MAHDIPYVATATVADLRDLEAKVEQGHDACTARATCTCWCRARSAGAPPPTRPSGSRGRPPRAGLFPVFEAEHGEVVAATPIRRHEPVEDYLKAQKRFAHLFAPVRRDDVIDRIQAAGRPERSHRYGLARPTRRCRMSDLPFAISLESASSLANHTGSWRVQRPLYVDLQPPCATACPAGESVQKWLYTAEDGSYEAAWRAIMAENPFPAVMGRVCYHPCQTACNRAQLDEAVGINSVERFLGDLALRRGLDGAGRARRPAGGPCWSSAPGRAGLAAAYHLRLLGHDVTLRDTATGRAG